MAGKVNKSYFFSLPFPYKRVCTLFVMSHSTEKGGGRAVYDFIT